MNPGKSSKCPLLLILGFATAVFLLLSGPGEDAAAHANLSRAEPAPNSELPEPPERIALGFSEGIEPDLADIQILNALGDRADNGDVSTQGDPIESVFVSVPVLENGTYTVSWANVSVTIAMCGSRGRGWE